MYPYSMTLTIYPAIDLRNGKCVRLFQGRADKETVYFPNPLDPAHSWEDQGAKHLHVVDLDGAFTGGSKNLEVVSDIVHESGLQVQLGGGMRDEETISKVLNIGVKRVIIGTRACNEPEWIGSLISRFGKDKIVVGIDANDGMVSTKGWVEKTEVDALELAKRLAELGLQWIIHTDIATDGAMVGPNLEAQAKMAEAVPQCKIIASGGVSKKEDLDNLDKLATDHPNIEGVIIGKALYEKTIDLTECIQ